MIRESDHYLFMTSTYVV